MGAADVERDPVRIFLRAALTERGLDFAEVSRAIGKNQTYIQQFLTRGVPAKLKERDRAQLADLLGVDEVSLGAEPVRKNRDAFSRLGDVRQVSEYNALASAGGGIMIEDEERTGNWPLPRPYLDEMHLSGGELAVIPVKGDSMEPTLRSGDRVLIDLGDKNVSQGGLFVIFDGVGRVVKRVERVPGLKPPKLALISDNPLHGRYEVDAEHVDIIGRIVWAGRRL